MGDCLTMSVLKLRWASDGAVLWSVVTRLYIGNYMDFTHCGKLHSSLNRMILVILRMLLFI